MYEVVHDGCLKIVKRYADGTTKTQKKRRRTGFTENQCTWHPTVHCDDHPKR